MNPILPIIVREADGIRAKVIARYGSDLYFRFILDYNNTKEADLEGLQPSQIEDAVGSLDVELGCSWSA